MRLVVDTNQARLIPATLRSDRPTGRARGLTLPPYVLAELLLRGQAPRKDTLRRLRSHHVRVGLETVMVYETLARMHDWEIQTFEPFPAPGDDFDRASQSLLREDGPRVSAWAEQWAQDTKAANLTMVCGFLDAATISRRELRQTNSPKFRDFGEVVRGVAHPVLKRGVMRVISDDGRRGVIVTDPDALYYAVMKNPNLRRFFHASLFYDVSIYRGWTNQRLNRDPLPNRDDWTDVTIALYVSDHDIVVTEDRLVRDAFESIDPSVRVVAARDM
jgi:hypothetical protein